MKKPIIGILPSSNYMVTNDTFQDSYKYGNNYIKRIMEAGGIPLLIPLVDENVIQEAIEMCDGLILPGGNRIRPYALKIIDYFYTNDKPILGICLGMQTLAVYSVNIDDEIEDKMIMKPIENGTIHWPVELSRDENDKLAHDIVIEKNSKLFELLNSEKVKVNSVHKYTITRVGKDFDVCAKSDDGIIEGIEAKNKKFVVGVQFHPEVLDQFKKIFDDFISSCSE